MKLTNQYVEMLQSGNSKGLAELFDINGSITDYCPGENAYEAYGNEAIEMLYRNRFYFKRFEVLKVIDVTENHAMFIAAYDGYRRVARATIQKVDSGDKIRRIVVRPM